MSGKEKNVKKKKHKLLVQISIIVNLIFVATLVFTAFTDYFITQDTYLSSKNEMIERDLLSVSDDISSVPDLSYIIGYAEENSQDIKRSLTKEEITLQESDKFFDYLDRLLDGTITIDEIDDPKIRSVINIQKYHGLDTVFRIRDGLENYNYYLIDIIDEHNSYLIMSNPDDPENIGEKISYEGSEHSAISEILSGRAVKDDEPIYEIYYDSSDGKSYYLGYVPILNDEDTHCYLCIKYDWSKFRSELINRSINSMIIGFIVLAALNGLLMMFIYMKAVSPIQKVTAGVMEYKENNDMTVVSERMDNIRVQNEIGVLASSFVEFAEEIDKHTNEILKLNSEKERIATELSLATNIQSSMLPAKFPAFPNRKEFDIFASMDPAKEVGGDFYDLFLIDNDHLAMVIADVSGKGVPAALFMMSSMILINDHALMGGTPAEILDRINKQVCKTNKANMFVTVWLGILEISTGKLTAASAGHEFPMLNTNGKFELLRDKHGTPVGAFKKSKYKDYELTLKMGDSLFLYTDGVAEATDADNQLFGTERTLEALNKNPDAAPEELLKNVRKAVDEFVKDAPQFDDLTMLGFRYFGKEENNNE